MVRNVTVSVVKNTYESLGKKDFLLGSNASNISAVTCYCCTITITGTSFILTLTIYRCFTLFFMFHNNRKGSSVI